MNRPAGSFVGTRFLTDARGLAEVRFFEGAAFFKILCLRVRLVLAVGQLALLQRPPEPQSADH